MSPNNHPNSEIEILRLEIQTLKGELSKYKEIASYQKSIEAALQESEQKFRMISEQSLLGIAIIQNGLVKYANQAYLNNVGIAVEELYKMEPYQILDLIYEEDREFVKKQLHLKETGTPGYQAEYRIRLNRSDGSLRYLYTYSKTVNYKGKPADFVTQVDITDSVEAEKRIKASEEKYKKLFEDIDVLIYQMDKNAKYIFVNKAFKKLLGYSDELYGINALTLIHKDDLDKIMNNYESALDGTKGAAESRFKKKNGEYILLKTYYFPDLDESGNVNGFFGIAQDITHQKKIEEDQLRAEKIESISLLAAGIAHDFNNILAAILGNVNLIQLDKTSSVEIQRSMNEIETAILRASDLTKQLSAFSKGGDPVKKIQKINPIINDCISLVMRGSNSKSMTQFDKDLLSVDIDAGQINQVINNLLINSLQAMPNGGLIQINASNVVVDENSDLPLHPGNYIKIKITDTGEGIAQSDVDKIFQPYFTTKSTGTGLGLATCYTIVKKHQGHIDFISEQNKGTTFFIYLPAVKEHGLISEELIQSQKEFSGKVLVLDDEKSIQETLTNLLEHFGLTVDIASDGEEALEIFSRNHSNDSYKFVILDLTIPGGSGGEETMQNILKIDPNVKAIVTSGYSNHHVILNYADYGFFGVLIKPYSIEKLKEVISNVL